MSILLFLDFDGVLHPASPFNRDVGVFCHLDRFEAVMRDFPEFHIVISSSWSEQFDLETLRSFFSDDIAERVIGVTPALNLNRQREIEHFLQDNNSSALWVALDDAAEEFEPGLPNLVLCSTQHGFDDQAESELRSKLTEVINEHGAT